MRIISTRVHGILDYLISIVLLSYPVITGFHSPDNWISAFVGFGIGAYSLLTHYETGLIKRISIFSHIVLDICTGIFLVLSPWVFNFNKSSALFYFIAGSVLLVYTLVTDSRAYYRRYVLHPGMYSL